MRRALLCLLCLGFAVHAPLRAEVSRAQAAPGRVTVPSMGPLTVTVTWTVTRSRGQMREPLTAIVTSRSGEVVIDGAVAVSLGQVLSRASTLGASGQETLLFTETLMLDRDIAVALTRAGRASLRRTFTDSYGSAIGEVVLVPQTGLSAAFAITRMELRFPDFSRTRLIRQGEDVRVDAVVNFNGSGVGRFAWQLAGPVPAGGAPVYRTIEQINVPLAAGGREVLSSPALPTDRAGAYFVRLQPMEAATGLALPIIRYVVIRSRAADGPVAMEDVQVRRPAAGARLAEGAVFEWQPVAGATAYRVEFYSSPEAARVPGAAPVAGAVVSGDEASLRIAGITLDKLPERDTLYWRLTAFDAQGTAIGVSQLRRIVFRRDAPR